MVSRASARSDAAAGADGRMDETDYLVNGALTVAADLTLIAHTAFIVFVVAGQVLILAGWMRG